MPRTPASRGGGPWISVRRKTAANDRAVAVRTRASGHGILLTREDTRADGVRVESEEVADVDEREGPRSIVDAHPCGRVGGERTESVGRRPPALTPPTALEDALHRILQDREHQRALAGEIGIESVAAGDLPREQGRLRRDQLPVESVDHLSLLPQRGP